MVNLESCIVHCIFQVVPSSMISIDKFCCHAVHLSSSSSPFEILQGPPYIWVTVFFLHFSDFSFIALPSSSLVRISEAVMRMFSQSFYTLFHNEGNLYYPKLFFSFLSVRCFLILICPMPVGNYLVSFPEESILLKV